MEASQGPHFYAPLVRPMVLGRAEALKKKKKAPQAKASLGIKDPLP